MQPVPPPTTNPIGNQSASSRHGQILAAAVPQTTNIDSTVNITNPSTTTNNHHTRHKKPTLDEVVDSVFQSITGDYGEVKGFDVPENFYDFYDNPLFRHFLACIVYYYFGFVDVRKLEHRKVQLLDEGGHSNSPNMDHLTSDKDGKGQRASGGAGEDNQTKYNEHSDVNTRELHFSKLELRRRLRLVGEAYSRLLLNCSNFEHTSEDKRFFEFIFEFTRSVTRLAIDKQYWDEMEETLSYLFRGYMFNNPALRSKTANRNEPLNIQEDLNNDKSINTANNDSSASLNKSNDPTEVAKKAIGLARRTLAKYRSRVTGAPRARGIRATRRMRKKRLHEAASNDITTGLLPEGNLVTESSDITHQYSTRRSMSSVREIINARSPLVAMLLPTPDESLSRRRIKTKNIVKKKEPTKNNSQHIESSKAEEFRSVSVAPKFGKRNRSKKHQKRGAALFKI
jgi:hypothetical protein